MNLTIILKKLELFFRKHLLFIGEFITSIIALLIIISNLLNPPILTITSGVIPFMTIILKSIDIKVKISEINFLEKKILEKIKSEYPDGISIVELNAISKACIKRTDMSETVNKLKNEFLTHEKGVYLLNHKAKLQLK